MKTLKELQDNFFKVGDKVAYETKKNEFNTGVIRYIDKINNKAQVRYDHNGISYWINLSNLWKVEKKLNKN